MMKKIIIGVIVVVVLWPLIQLFIKKVIKVEATTQHAVTAVEDVAVDLSTTDNTHLRFKNVPIDGTLKEFVARMKQGGFKVEDKSDGQAVLSGDFADFKTCTVNVVTLTGKDLVYKITVSFPSQEQWKYLYGDYTHLKELLTDKYGDYTSCVEEFPNTYGMKIDDMNKMLYVNMNKCKYETQFVTDKGEIVLWIEHGKYSEAYVMLSYTDKINGSVIKEHALDDL